MNLMNEISEKNCKCKKEHIFESEIIIGKNVIMQLPQTVRKFDAGKIFLIADKNTFSAAGERVYKILKENGISVCKYVFKANYLEPDEANVGLALMNFGNDCDLIVGVGSGVINDISKIVSFVSGKPYIIVATAPSMDGYASSTSSMTMEGLKISLNSRCADVIIGDTDILCNAPLKMIISGLGDMLAKYVSICEWRISNLINGEYYCEKIAKLVRTSLRKCVDNAEGILKRDENAVKNVFEGLIICGAAMKFAGLSRPASGIEHYLSHVWDMRGVEFGMPVEFHGLQCAVGTYISIKLYEKIKKMKPDKCKALTYVKNFDFSKWSSELKSFMGKSADVMISQEKTEQKYSAEKHKERFEIIEKNWDKIIEIINEELPTSDEIEKLLNMIGAPKMPEEIGINNELIPMTFKASKDIRYKYVLSHLAWDLGVIDELFI